MARHSCCWSFSPFWWRPSPGQGSPAWHLTGRSSPIWVANAVIAIAALKTRRRMLPFILIAGYCGLYAGDLLGGDTLLEAIVLSAVNILEVSLLVVPLRRIAPDLDFGRPRTLLAFYGLAMGLAPVVSATLATLFLGQVRGLSFWSAAPAWYAGAALGLIIVVPPLIATRNRDFVAIFKGPALAGTLGAASALVLALLVNFIGRDYPVAFLFFPAILLMTYVRGFAGGTLGLLAVDTYVLVPVLVHHPANTLVMHPLRDQIMIILLFAAVMSFTVVLAGAALEHRRRLEREMARALVRAEELREEALVAKDAAENANRTKSMFLANMSHELRTPLNAVIGFSEIMREEMFGPVGDVRYRDYTRMIHDAGEHLLELINDILDMSKIEAGKFEIERVAHGRPRDRQRLRDVDAGPRGGRWRRADQSCCRTMPLWVMADRRAIKQILLNLLSNAVKFTPAGGAVTVHLAQQGSCGGEPAWRLAVRDTGIGIPPEAVKRLGNPFVQIRDGADRAHQGTGLGLALVRALAEMHDGALHIESAPGAGTTVTVDLPIGGIADTATELRAAPRAAGRAA